MSVTVEISEDGGEYTAIDSETGEVGIGSSRAMALAALAVRLGTTENPTEDAKAELRSLADRTRRRFERDAHK